MILTQIRSVPEQKLRSIIIESLVKVGLLPYLNVVEMLKYCYKYCDLIII